MDADLAGRGTRLGAYLIDFVLWVIPALPLIPSAVRGDAEPPLVPSLITAALVLGYFVLYIWMLTARGQTPGKWILKIRIVKVSTGENGGFVPNVLLRGFVNGVLDYIPFYALADALFIFRDDRRCIHDLLAGTQVVRA